MLSFCAYILFSLSLLKATYASSHQPLKHAESASDRITCNPDCVLHVVDKESMSRSESGSKLATSKILRAGSNGMNFLPFLSMKSSSASASQRKTPSLRSEEQVRAIRWEERIGRASAKGLTMYMQSFAETILLFFAISLVLNMNVLTKVVPTALSASHPFSKLRNWIVSAATGGADWANISALYAVRPFVHATLLYPLLVVICGVCLVWRGCGM